MADMLPRDELLRDAPEMSFEEFNSILQRVDPESKKAGSEAIKSLYEQRVKGAKDEAQQAKVQLNKTTTFVQNATQARLAQEAATQTPVGTAPFRTLPPGQGPPPGYSMTGPSYQQGIEQSLPGRAVNAVMPHSAVDWATLAAAPVIGKIGAGAATVGGRLAGMLGRTAANTGVAAATETATQGAPGRQTVGQGLGAGLAEGLAAAVGPVARHIPGIKRMIQDREAQRLAGSLHQAAPAAVQPIPQRRGALGELMSARADDVAQQGISGRLEAQLSNLQAQVPQGSGLFSPTLLREVQELAKAARGGDEVAMRLLPNVKPDEYGQLTVQQAQELLASLRDRYVGKVTNPAMADRADRQAAQVVASVIDEFKQFANQAAGRPVPQRVATGLQGSREEYGVGKAVRELLQGSKAVGATGVGPEVTQAKLMDELVNNAPKWVQLWGRPTYDQVIQSLSRGAGPGFKDTATKGLWARIPVVGDVVSHGTHVGAGRRYVGEPPLNVGSQGRESAAVVGGGALRHLLGTKEREK